jgi:integrase
MAKRRGSGDGSIFQLPNGRWVAMITISSGGGRQVRRKRSAKSYSAARKHLAELHKERDLGLIGTSQTVAKYLDEWRIHVLPARSVTTATVENYTTMIDLHIVPCIGHLRLDRLRAAHVDELLRGMNESGKAKSTVRLARTVLCLALTHAERRDLITRNAARLSIVPPGGSIRVSRSLTTDQARELLVAARTDRLEAAWVTGLLLGLRPGEVFALSWDDIDFDTERITVRQAIRRATGAKFELGAPKTDSSMRTLGMPTLVVEAFQRHQTRQKEERMAAGPEWKLSSLVFTTPWGEMINPSTSRAAFSRLTKVAGLGHWRPHELRHSMVSILSDGDVPLEQIADVAGHAPGSKVTGAVYRHRISPSVDVARAAMDGLFSPLSNAG